MNILITGYMLKCLIRNFSKLDTIISISNFKAGVVIIFTCGMTIASLQLLLNSALCEIIIQTKNIKWQKHDRTGDQHYHKRYHLDFMQGYRSCFSDNYTSYGKYNILFTYN